MSSRSRTLPRRLWFVGSFVLLAIGLARPAIAQDFRAVEREVHAIERESSELLAESMETERARSPHWVEEHIADAEIYYRLHDYLRASILLTDILDHYPNHPAIPDARLLLANALFEAGDMLGARVQYTAILDHANEPGYSPYAETALGRVVEIALRTRSFEGVQAYFDRISADASSEAAAATTYFRAKYLYGLAVPESVANTGRLGNAVLDTGRVEQARQLFASVATHTSYSPQARYFAGVILVLRQQYPEALVAFGEVAGEVTSTPEHRRVGDLAWLAIGRVRHAAHQYTEALEAYGHVARTSPLFPRALYESAWVHVALEDPTSATRALEVLAVAAPESPLIPEAQLVRANLMLRNHRLREADVVFDEVANTAQPVADELEAMATAHADLPAYFAGVVREQRETFSVDVLMPASALRWSEPDPEFQHASAALADLTLTRQLIRETAELVERLERALESAAIVNVFSDTRNQSQTIEALRNRIVRARSTIMRAEERSGAGQSPELGAIRERRRALERELSSAPTTGDAMDERDGRRVMQVRALDRRVREIEVEVIGLEARITAMEHFLEQRPMDDPAGNAAVRAELANHRASVAEYRRQIEALRSALEAARLDVGVGDDQYQHDAALRAEYEQLVSEERRLSGRQGGAGEAYFQRLLGVETQLTGREQQILRVVHERTANIRQVVTEERANLDVYRTRLAELEGEAEIVVGGVSYDTFRRTRQRFYDIVLRAHVGHVDVAWMNREEHRQELENLVQTRALELEEIDAEFNDINDRNAGTGGGTP